MEILKYPLTRGFYSHFTCNRVKLRCFCTGQLNVSRGKDRKNEVFKSLKDQKVLSLKEFMVRSEVLDLYRKYMKLGRLIGNDYIERNTSEDQNSTKNLKYTNVEGDTETVNEKAVGLRKEWNDWVRCEFRLRSPKENPETADLDSIKSMLSMGKKQLQELESSIRIGQNLKPSNRAKVKDNPSPENLSTVKDKDK